LFLTFSFPLTRGPVFATCADFQLQLFSGFFLLEEQTERPSLCRANVNCADPPSARSPVYRLATETVSEVSSLSRPLDTPASYGRPLNTLKKMLRYDYRVQRLQSDGDSNDASEASERDETSF